MLTLVHPPPFEPISEECPGCKAIDRLGAAERKAAGEDAVRTRRYGLRELVIE